MSLRDVVDGDHDCHWLVECVHGCGQLDREIFCLLLDAEDRLTIDDIADYVDRDRSTTYRAVRRLEDHGYLEREQRTYENGGYCFQYGTVPPEQIAAELEATIKQSHQHLDSLLAEFREIYCEKSGRSSGAS